MDDKPETRMENSSKIPVWTGLNNIVLAAIAIIFFYARNAYRPMFEELGVALPMITHFLLYSHPAIWSAVFVVFFFAIWANELISPDATARILNSIFTLILLAFLVIFVVALYLPLIELMSILESALI